MVWHREWPFPHKLGGFYFDRRVVTFSGVPDCVGRRRCIMIMQAFTFWLGNRRRMNRNAVLAVATIALQVGCIGTVALTAQTKVPPAQVSFNKHVSPVLKKYCAGCHGGQAPRADVRLDFASDDEARRIAATADDFWG